jgi:predicted enzyme related to lactoylglutathione lyase
MTHPAVWIDAGGALLVEPWDLPGMGTMAVIGDPDGNRIGVWTPPA